MIKKGGLIGIIAVVLLNSVQAQFECDWVDPSPPSESSGPCINNTLHPENAPVGTNPVPFKEIAVMFHIVRDNNGDNNFQNTSQDLQQLQDYLDTVNHIYSHLIVQVSNETCDYTYVEDSRIRFVNKGVKFYENSTLICTDTKCPSAGNDVYNFCITNNSTLTYEEKNNYFPILVVGWAGARGPDEGDTGDCDRSGCNSPSTILAGRGPSDYVILRGLYTYYSHISGIGELMSHELGHSFGLPHSWFETCCQLGNKDYSNNVMDYDNYAPFFDHLWALVECQLGEMHYTIEHTTQSKFLDNDLCVKESETIVIPEGETVEWTIDELLNQDVSVFGTLVISCTVTIAPDVSIKVQEGGFLYIDGGTLTSCDDTWTGIRVVGDAISIPDVKIEDAIIENTSGPAISMIPPLAWPAMADYGNGEVIIDNSIFNNCYRMVEFISFTQQANNSVISNSIQNGGKWGITNWNCLGVQVVDCEFNDLQSACIVGYDGSYYIAGNQIETESIGILFTNTLAAVHSVIENENEIRSEGTGLHSVGTTVAYNEVFNNVFDVTGKMSIFMDDDNHYLIRNNEFDSGIGVRSVWNGSDPNTIQLNSFSNVFGIATQGANRGYTFLENCFNTTIHDAYLVGSISPYIGSVERNAENCFTHMGTGPDSDLAGYPEDFTYYVPNDVTLNCYDVLNNTAGITLAPGPPDVDQGDCGVLVSPTPYQDGVCWPIQTINAVTDALDSIEEIITDIENDSGLTTEEKKALLAKYEGCKKRVTRMFFELLILDKDYQDARALVRNDTAISSKVLVYSSYVMENDLDSALYILNRMSTSREETEDFVTIQKINLRRLENGPFYNFSVATKDTILEVAEKEHTMAAYAKSLYYVLTDTLVQTVLPDTLDYWVTPRSSKAPTQSPDITVYPNPFSSNITIDLNSQRTVEIRLLDTYGRIVQKRHANSNIVEIPTSILSTGQYFLVIYENGNIIFNEKLVHIHR